MKKTIYVIGIMSSLLITLGILFKIQHWAGAGILLCLGITSLVLVFIPLALINNYKHAENRPGKWFYIIGYITCLVFYASTLFKIMHWPGAGKLLMIAIPFPFIVFLPVFLYYSRKEDFFSITQSAIVILLLAYVSVMTAVLSLNISKNIIDDSILVQNEILVSDKVYINHRNEITGKINQLKDDELEAKLKAITKEGQAVYSLIDTIQWSIVCASNPDYVNRPVTDINFPVRGMDDKSTVQKVMFGDQEYALKLKKSFDHYKNYVLGMLPSEQKALRQLVEKSFSTSIVKVNDNEMPWENFYFSNVQMIWAQSNLTQFQSNILLVESELLDWLYFAQLTK